MIFEVINTQSYLTDEARRYLEENDCRIRDIDLVSLTEDEFCRQIRGVEGVIAGGERWTEKIFEAADRLKIVARTGAGVEHVDLDAAARHKVWVTNTPGATSRAVADLTVGLMLSLLRSISTMVSDIKNGKWEKLRGRELGSMVVGVIGTGGIGREVIKRVAAFGAQVLAYDVQQDEALCQDYRVQYVPLNELLAKSDIVTLHCPITNETRHLIDERALRLMRKTAYLVNTSRPALVDKQALIGALQSGLIAAAAIDVHDTQPCEPNDPLVMLDNVIATPWVGFNTEESVARMCITAAQDTVSVLRGERPRHPVNNL